MRIRIVSWDCHLETGDHFIGASGPGQVRVQLPRAVGAGSVVIVKNLGASRVDVIAVMGDTIDGSAEDSISALYESHSYVDIAAKTWAMI